jgi:hypothetical protein
MLVQLLTCHGGGSNTKLLLQVIYSKDHQSTGSKPQSVNFRFQYLSSKGLAFHLGSICPLPGSSAVSKGVTSGSARSAPSRFQLSVDGKVIEEHTADRVDAKRRLSQTQQRNDFTAKSGDTIGSSSKQLSIRDQTGCDSYTVSKTETGSRRFSITGFVNSLHLF